MKYTNESGRSMVEMLGVLAIIGVLSVGGIAGYSKAMNKFKINKTTDQVSMLVANIRTIYSTQGNYSGLTNTTAVSFGVVPNDMLAGTAGEGADAVTTLKNAFGGAVTIEASPARGTGTGETSDEAFIIEYAGLSKEACVTIATGDWGSGQSSGLLGIAAGQGAEGGETSGTLGAVGHLLDDIYTTSTAGSNEADKAVSIPGGGENATPMKVTHAVTACSGDGTTNSVAWKYY